MMKQQTAKQNLQAAQANQLGGQATIAIPSSNTPNLQQQKAQQGSQQNVQQQQQQVINQQKYQDMKRIEDYTFCLSDLVGKGASGTVYLGENSVTKDLVAIKVIDLHQVKDEYTWGLICSEIDIMKKLKCENVVKLIDVFQTQNNAYIITELCEDGDLVDFMKRNAGKIRQNQAVKIITDILRGLQELAKHGIIHRDLKPANILISKKDVFKITDFGFARMVEKTDYLMTSLVGTPLYMSPQILKRQMYTSKCDVWSIGLIFYELIYGQTPWPSNSVIDLVNNMFSNPLKFPNVGQAGDVILEDVKDFIKGCLKFEEADRLGWEEVYRHSLFKDVLYAYAQKSPNNTSIATNNPFSNQDDRGSQLKSPNNHRDSLNKKGSFISSFQTSFMTTYTSSGNSNTTKNAKGNNNSNSYQSKQQNNLYSNQKQAKGGSSSSQGQKQQQAAQSGNTNSQLNTINANSNNQNIINGALNSNNNNTTLSSSTNSSNNNTQNANQVQGIAAGNNNNIQSILNKDFNQKTKTNSRQSTPSIQKQATNQSSQPIQPANPAGVNDAKNQNNFESSQQSTPRQQSKLGNQYQTAAKLANINNATIPQSGSFIANSPANNYQPAQQQIQCQQPSSFNVQNRQSQINSPHLKDKKANGQATLNQATSSFLQQNISSQSQNKLENMRQQYKKQVKDKKSSDYQYGQGSIHNLPNENQINNNVVPICNHSGVVYGSINSNPSEKSNVTAAGTATSSNSSSSFNFIHKRQKSARDVISNYNSAQNNFYIPLTSPTKHQAQSDKYRILTEPNQMNECKDNFSPNKNNTIMGINRESNFQNSQGNQNQLPQSSSSPLSTEPSQNPVPTVLITLGSMNQIIGGNSINNGRVNSPTKTEQVSGNMLNFSNDHSQSEINSLYSNPQLNNQIQIQRVGQGVINLEQSGTPEKQVGLQLKQCFYQQKGYLKNNTRSITPTMSASAQKGISPNTSNNTPKVSQHSDTGNKDNNGLSNSKKALSNFNKFATFVYNTEDRGSKLSSNSNYISSNSHQNASQSSKNSNGKRQKFNNRLSQQQQQSQIQTMTTSKLSDPKSNLNINNFNSSNTESYQSFDPFKTADQVLINNFAVYDESLNSSGSPKNYDKQQQDNLIDQQQVLVAQNLNRPQHNYVQLNLNSSNSGNIAYNLQSDKKFNSSQSPSIKGANQGLNGKQNHVPCQYKSYDFSNQIQKADEGVNTQKINQINLNQGSQMNQAQSPTNQQKNSLCLVPQIVQCRLDEQSQNDNKNSDTNSEKSPQHILNNPIINLNRREISSQQKQQITQVNLNYPLNMKNILGTTTQPGNSQYLGSPATNNSNIFSQLYNLEIGNQQINSATNHVAVNLVNPSSYQSPIIENKSVSSNVASSQAMTPLDLKKTHSDFLSPQLKNNKFSFDSSSINITPQAHTTTNQQNTQIIQQNQSNPMHNRYAQKSSDFTSFQSNFINSLVQQENYSSSDILNNYLNFCKLLSNLVRIINNSNFDKMAFQSSNFLLEKITFILLKNAMIKLTKVNDKMYANGENIFNLNDWNTFKISGKYTEMQTSFFLLYTEIQSSFEQEWNKGNNHSTQSQQINQDYSFVQLFNKDMTDDVRFYSISLSFVKSFIQLLNQKLSMNPQTSLQNINPIFTDKNDIVAVTLLNDFLEYHEILKTNLISMDSFHNQIFTKFNTFLSKFNNTYNYLTLVSKNFDAQFITNLQIKLKSITP
ncbi:Serine/Threonine kinase domain protein (macronuclear) [Tetrahymena thermophila SB210]|uniref:Serine/Threonine kinase domain protein n=1 Tax=Tetrahymena thermophila (strain SB210) TaxID=312017 RepID=Q23R97_TETTS|nr:Serine/Threonine kinase domain protein [Tetrahymena thermophila SB210]EAR99151.2 Serine/Threonine kinase domain protein [Tetrahymena thermophila SB210]|eukprot:XP_001019396.2 Serine/Threonine kinase domain protein [Tetrahymena thermophila SB210]